MPRLIDVRERSDDVTDAVLRVAGRGGVAAVTLPEVALRAGLSVASVRYARPTRDRLLHLAVSEIAKRRSMRRRDVWLHIDDPVVRVVDCWLPLGLARPAAATALSGPEEERGWQAFRSALPVLRPETAVMVRGDDTELTELCAAASGSTTATLLLIAAAEGLVAAVARGSVDVARARDLLARAAHTAAVESRARVAGQVNDR